MVSLTHCGCEPSRGPGALNTGFMAYLITARGAARALELISPVDEEVDIKLNRHALRLRWLAPAPKHAVELVKFHPHLTCSMKVTGCVEPPPNPHRDSNRCAGRCRSIVAASATAAAALIACCLIAAMNRSASGSADVDKTRRRRRGPRVLSFASM